MDIARRNIKYITIMFLFSACIFVILQLSFNIVEVFVTSLGRDMTFTDRVSLWRDLLEFDINPVIGVGYDSFWIMDRMQILWETRWWRPNQAHNGYLDVYLELGMLGLFIWLVIIATTFRNISKVLLIDFNYGRFQMAFLFIFLLFNITEANLKIRTTMFFLFILTTLYTNHNILSKNPNRDHYN